MKIAILGSTGLLGSNLAAVYKNIDIKLFARNKDIFINEDTLSDVLNSTFSKWKPDIIINAIGIVNIELCEKNMDLAKRINTYLPKIVAQIAKELNSYYIHISTDHFYKDKIFLHKEEESVFLLNNYAKSKFCAEKEVLNILEKALIVRTNIIGFRRNNNLSFFEWLVNSLEKKENIILYDDFITSPISVQLLANILIDCYNKSLYGVFNIASHHPISKYEFGKAIAKKFELNFNNVERGTTKSINSTLERSFNNGLDVTKIEKCLNKKMPKIEDTIAKLYYEYKEYK